MGKVSFAAFSRYMGLGSGFSLIFGGIFGCFYSIFPLGVYAAALGLFVMIFEYPMWGIKYLGPINELLWIRGIFYILTSGPAAIQVPSVAGAFFIFITGCTYIWASYRGEKWKDPFASGGGEEGGSGGKREGGGRGEGGRGGEGEKKKTEKKAVKYDEQGYVIEDAPAPAPAKSVAADPYAAAYGGGYEKAGYNDYNPQPAKKSAPPPPGPAPAYSSYNPAFDVNYNNGYNNNAI